MEQLDAVLDEIAAGNPTLATDSHRWRPTDAASTIMRRLQEIRTAEAEVEPVVGSVLGMDSAAAIYGEALRRLGRDTRGLQGNAAAAIFQLLRNERPRVAYDPKREAAYAARFPNAGRLTRTMT